MFALAPIALLPLTPQLTDTLDQILAGSPVPPPAGILTVPAPAPAVTVNVPASSDRPPAAGPGAAAATQVAAAPSDLRAPGVAVRVLSRARRAAQTGRLRVAVRIDEPGVVALAAALRPGAKVRSARGRHWRGVIHGAPVVQVLATPGEHVVALKLPRENRRHLGRARDARVSLAVLGADAARNQVGFRVKRTVGR